MNQKEVELIDVWEESMLHITVFHPAEDEFSKLRINGACEELGKWN